MANGHAPPGDARCPELFDARWGNGRSNRYSLPFEAFADDSTWRYWRYRFMEASGLSTF